jgi:ketosteroid isomerase-like protein
VPGLEARPIRLERAVLGLCRDHGFAAAMADYEPGSVRIEVTAMIAEQDHVVLQWTSRARMSDGEPYENGCIGVFTVRDGKIQVVREHMDTLYACDAFWRAGSPHGPVVGGV